MGESGLVLFLVGKGGSGCRSACQSAQQAEELIVLIEAGWENNPA